MDAFISASTCQIPEFDNDLVRRLIACIRVISADRIEIQFQSGIVMEQEIVDVPSKDYSYLYHYPKNIKEDWLALLKECEQMLIEDGIIHGDNQAEGLEELQEKQSGGMQMI